MKTYELKINASNLKNEIERDYFKYKDIFYKCLIGNLCLYNTLYGEVLSNTIIGESHHNQYLLSLINRPVTLASILQEIDTPHNLTIFLDTNLYIQEFITTKHQKNKINVYTVDIDDMHRVIVLNKTLNRYAP
jgi:hypothetical protein